MSRIPVPTHTIRAHSPPPSSSSPEHINIRPNTLSDNSSVHFSPMSSLSGFQSSVSLSETRKKQSKRDEVSFLLS